MFLKHLTNSLTKAFNDEEALPQRRDTLFIVSNGYGIKILNDDETPMNFVAAAFRKYLELDQSQAFNLMAEVHENGEAVWYGTDADIAEEICSLITTTAQERGFPLKCYVVPPLNTLSA